MHKRIFPVAGEQLHVGYTAEQVSFCLRDGSPAPDELVRLWAREWPANEDSYFLIAACPQTSRTRIINLIAAAADETIGGVDIKAMRHAVCRWPRCDSAMLCRLVEARPETVGASDVELLLTHPAADVEVLATIAIEMKRRSSWPSTLPLPTLDTIQGVAGMLGVAAIRLAFLPEDHHRDPAGQLANQLAWLEERPAATDLVAGLGATWTGDRKSLLATAGMLAAA